MLPPIDHLAPQVNPTYTGLYAVATLIDTTLATRLSGGVRIHPVNCGGNAGTWPSDPCAAVPGELRKAGTRPSPADPFPPVTVWGWDQCDPTETEADVRSRAEQAVRLSEQGMVESALSLRLATDGAPLGSAGNVVDAVGLLEQALAEAGITGVIYANARVAAAADDHGLIIRTGGALRTPLGHLWAFGAGFEYGVMHATGIPTVWRDAFTTKSTVDPFDNLRVAVAERTVVAGYECYIAGVDVADQGA